MEQVEEIAAKYNVPVYGWTMNLDAITKPGLIILHDHCMAIAPKNYTRQIKEMEKDVFQKFDLTMKPIDF